MMTNLAIKETNLVNEKTIKPNLATKIMEFINYHESHVLAVQLWRLSENGGYYEIELKNPTISEDKGILTISSIEKTSIDVFNKLNLPIALSDIFSVNYSTTWLLITLKSGEAIKFIAEGCY